MKKKFQQYLRGKGYSEYTPSGNPSTVYDYAKRIDKVCKWEKIDWATLAQKIDSILFQYDVGGKNEALGKQSHRAVLNALKRFKEFLSKK